MTDHPTTHSTDLVHDDTMTAEVLEPCPCGGERDARHELTCDQLPGGRYLSPLGDHRERSVPCSSCRRRQTTALDARCNACAIAEAGLLELGQ